MPHRPAVLAPQSSFADFRFPWYLRYSLSYRDVEELLAERHCGGSRHALPVSGSKLGHRI
jgi:transposase-like protein